MVIIRCSYKTTCRIEFYQIFYSVFDNPHAAMDVILKRKEAFAFQVLSTPGMIFPEFKISFSMEHNPRCE